MKAWLADWLRHWAHKLDGRKVLTLDKADQYRVEVGYNWVKVTSLVDGTMHVGMPADKPVSFTSYGAGGGSGGRVSGVNAATGGGFGGTVTGRYSVTPPAPQDLPRQPARPSKPEPRLPDPFRRPRTAHDYTDPHDMGEGR